jgi:hypothetical protein
VVYFVTGDEEGSEGWENYFRNNLLKNYQMMPAVVELGPAFSFNQKNNQ